MLTLTKKELKQHQDATKCYICRKRFKKKKKKKFEKNKSYQKLRDHCHHTGKYRGAAHSISDLRFNVPK